MRISEALPRLERIDRDGRRLVDLDPALPITIYDYVGIQEEIARLFSQSVDVIDSAGLKPRMRTAFTRDLVYAF